MKRLVPDPTQMKMYLSRGLSHSQIAAAWERDSGIKCSRSAISMAVSRYGLKSANEKVRYKDLIPWKIRGKHMMERDARLLRLEARRRAGKTLKDKERVRLEGFIADLHARNAVIDYIPETETGFWWAKRLPTDTDIIRRPNEDD